MLAAMRRSSSRASSLAAARRSVDPRERLPRTAKKQAFTYGARTAVERDFRGDVVDAHAPEMPTRFGKQLAQMVRGGIAIGMSRGAAVRLALRCATT
jgi:hypothetical protein